MAYLKLAHIGYVVPRMESALKRFLAEGATILIPPTYDPNQYVEVTLLQIDGETPVELVAPTDHPDCPIKARLARGGGLDHLCYFTEDIEKSIKKEEAAGAMIVCQPTYAIAFKRDVAFLMRRSGLVIEFMTDEETSGDRNNARK